MINRVVTSRDELASASSWVIPAQVEMFVFVMLVPPVKATSCPHREVNFFQLKQLEREA